MIGFAVTSVVLAMFGGDNEPTFITITNATNQTVTVYLVDVAENRSKLLVVPARSARKLFGGCEAAELVAVGADSRDVATRPASQECNLTDWTIEGGVG